MTPKDKAKELVDRYYWTFGDGYLGEQHIQCALIAVDEMISADWFIPTYKDKTQWETYWSDVRNEIEKL